MKIILAPKLRFKGFEGNWKTKCVIDLASKLNVGFVGTCEPFYTSSEEGVLLVRTGNLKGVKILLDEEKYVTKEFHSKNKKSQIFPGDLLLARHGGNGEICMVPKGFPDANSLNIVILRTNSELQSDFFQLAYSSFSVQKQISSVTAGSTQGVINTKEIAKLEVVYPCLPEQNKIASFISVVDEKIHQLNRKKELLESYKKGVMQQLFSGKLRFKDENGKAFPKWEEKLLGDIAEKISTKNRSNKANFVLTNSATQGIVSQDEYFDREIANQNNLEGYYIVSVNDFVYNPRISVNAPVGPIKRNKLKEGVMSPLYLIFKFYENNLEYFEFLFETKLWHTYLESVSNIGARHDRMNIANSDFFKMPIPLPCSEERNKITNFLTELTKKITVTKNELDQTQTFKKGLLQQMFV